MFVGVVLGIIIGCCPAWAARTASPSCCLSRSPWRSSRRTTSAIILLSCIYWARSSAEAIHVILFNIPGEPWSVATTFDGHPLAQLGRAGAR